MPVSSLFRCIRRVVGVAAAPAVFLAAPMQAQSTWSALLAPEAVGASGSGFAFFSLSGNVLSISANWTGLSGVTTVAHIHCCTASPGTGTVAVAVTPGTLPGFPPGVTSGSYDAVIDLGLQSNFTSGFFQNFGGSTLSGSLNALVDGFDTGRAYFNVHTSAFPGGEIRGFVATVPEPASIVLLGAGLLALAMPAVRRRIVRIR